MLTERSKQLVREAQSLSAAERIEVAESILTSLDEPDQKLDKLWAEEAEARLAAYRRGEIKAIGLAEVLAKYR